MATGPSEPSDPRFEEFGRLVEDGPKGPWLVLTHDNPDPDALASAAVLARILEQHFGRQVTCAYGGLIGRAENREMVRALKIPLSHLRALSFDDYRRFALVDAQPGTGNNQLPKSITADAVFDHHPKRRSAAGARFTDIRTEYGATATILGEYLADAGIEPTRALATALVYAIRSETQDFLRETGGPDKDLYDAVFPLVDKRALARIQSSRQPLAYFRNLHAALENLSTVETLIVSHLGVVEQPDIVPEIADLLLRLEGKTWSLSTGLYGDRVYLSIRTTNTRADAGGIMRKLVSRNGKGGGHGMLAGGWVKVTAGYAEDPPALQEQLARRLARILRKNPDRLQPLVLTAASADGQQGGDEPKAK
ncbi:MAG TPA: DHHA1 domain-containing protein [Thermoanaerobaculia bacterium]|nr:DHHA1 domain-containing protein [Thermoanaerobaculia bacterium]